MTLFRSHPFASSWAQPGERVPLAVLLVVLVGWSACVVSLNRGHLGALMDDGLYFVSAQAIRDGAGYTLPSQPGPPARPRYPIGLPALLAVGLWLVPGTPSLARDIVVGRAVVMGMGWVFFLAAYVWLRRIRVTPWVAVLIVLATAFHLTTVGLSAAIMSDIPFAAVASVLLARWAARRPARVSGRPQRSFWNGALAAAGCLLRGNGITLFLGSLVAACVGPRRRVASLLACVLGTALVILPLEVYARLHSGARTSSDYNRSIAAGWESLGAGLSGVGRNVVESACALPYIVMPALGTKYVLAHPLINWPVQVGIWLIQLVGTVNLVRVSRRRDLPAWTHAAGTFLVFWLWPWHFSERCVLSLFPGILWAYSRGIGVLARSLGGSAAASRRLGTLALVLSLAGSAATSGRMFWHSHVRGEVWANMRDEATLDEVLNVVRTRLEPNAVVVSMMPEMVYLYTGHQGVMMMDDGDRLRGRLGRREGIEAAINQNPGRPFYLLSAPADSNDFEATQTAALARDPILAFREIYRTPDNRYRLAEIRLGEAGGG